MNPLFTIYIALSVFFTWPILSTGRQLGVLDWDVLLFYHASVFKSAFEYASLPFWNPWYCGGNVLWQNPQVALVSPVYILSFVVSLPMAMKLTILLHYLAGFFGMHVLLTRHLRVTNGAAIVVLASIFTLAGGPAIHLAVGHATFLAYFYLPWLLAAFLAALETGALRYVSAAAAIVALMLYSGGLHIAFMAGVALGIFATIASVAKREWRPLVLLACVGAGAFLLSAPKLLPTLAFLRSPQLVDSRTFIAEGDDMTPAMLAHALAGADQSLGFRLAAKSHGWHEYGNYIGVVGVILILAGLVWVLADTPWRRERWLAASLAGTTLMLLLFTVGEFASYAPFMLLRRLPLFSTLRVPSRFSLLFVFFGTAVAGWLARLVTNEWPIELRRIVIFAALIVVGSLAHHNQATLADTFSMGTLNSSFHWMKRSPAPTVDAVTQADGRDGAMTRAVMQDRAILACYEPLQLTGGIQGDKPIVFAEGLDTAISDIAFGPNRIAFKVTSSAPGRLFLNQRYADGWTSDLGRLTVDAATSLGYVEVPAGTDRMITVSFVPPRIVPGLGLFAVGLIGVGLSWRRRLTVIP